MQISLTPDYSLFAIMVIFIINYFVVSKFFIRPINAVLESREQPSYELPMHRVIYREMPHVAAIVHTHSPFVTTLSVLRRPLPPVIDEMMLRFGGQIEVADYASSGTEDLGRHAVAALGKRPAAILASHGNVCVAENLSAALQLAIFMESAARVYVQALQIGEPSRIGE